MSIPVFLLRKGTMRAVRFIGLILAICLIVIVIWQLSLAFPDTAFTLFMVVFVYIPVVAGAVLLFGMVLYFLWEAAE